MTSRTSVSPISFRPAGKSIPITDIAASQSGQLVAVTASVGSQARLAHAPQPRQMRSKTIPVPAAIGALSSHRSTQIQRRVESLLLLVDHVAQVHRRCFDIRALALARADLSREHATPVHVLEVAIRKLVVPFGVDVRLGVDTEVPPTVLGKAVLFDEAILILG